MIRWIQQRPWLPESMLALAVFLLFGGADLALQGPSSLIVSLVLALSFIFVRRFVVLSPILVLTAAGAQIYLGLLPVVSSLAIPLLAFIVGAFTPRPWREINLAAGILGGILISANLAFNPALAINQWGIGAIDQFGRAVVFLVLALLAITFVSLAWLLGILLMTRLTHIGTDFDRLVYEEKQVRLAIELAEQSKRFEIARDINEHIVQRMAAIISNAEGGIYAAKSSPDAGLRALDKVLFSARAAHTELRRLFDMLNRGTIVASAPPGLDDLESLAVNLRANGLDVTITHFGNRFPITAAAELAIYRIAFDALQNVRQHNPKGTQATVEISWLEHGVQVMIKDNGVEVMRRAEVGIDGIPAPYEAKDDLDTLLEKVTGPGITAMRERAESYGGSLEANRVVGIGFTISAMFPDSQVRAAESEASN